MDFSVDVTAKSGSEYRVIVSTVNVDIFPDGLKDIIGNEIEIADVALERISGSDITSYEVLMKIASVIGEIFNSNENLILYFYCDDMRSIPRRNESITPQKYRSNLFSAMFDRYLSLNGFTDIMNVPVEIKADRDIYIHLIARTCHSHYLSEIRKFVVGQGK